MAARRPRRSRRTSSPSCPRRPASRRHATSWWWAGTRPTGWRATARAQVGGRPALPVLRGPRRPGREIGLPDLLLLRRTFEGRGRCSRHHVVGRLPDVSGCPVLRVATDGRSGRRPSVEVTVGRDASRPQHPPPAGSPAGTWCCGRAGGGWVLEDVGAAPTAPSTRAAGSRCCGSTGHCGCVWATPTTGSSRGSSPSPSGRGRRSPVRRCGWAGPPTTTWSSGTRRLSRHHAELLGDPAHGYEIVDRGSRNGTFVNGRRDRAGPAGALRPYRHRLPRVPPAPDRPGRRLHPGPVGRPGGVVEARRHSGHQRPLRGRRRSRLLGRLVGAPGRWTTTSGRSWRRVRVQQQQVGNDTRVRAEASLAAAYRASLAEAKVLEREAAQARRAGRREAAAELEDRARQEGRWPGGC